MRRFNAALILVAVSGLVACEDDGQEPVQRAPASVVALTPTAQPGTVGAAVAQPPRVRVRDANGDPVEGVAVTFAVTQGGGTLTGGTGTTDADGVAAAGGWTLGPQPGAHRVTATVANLAPVVFEAIAAAGPPAALEIVAGNSQSGSAGNPLPAPLVLRVRDALGNGVPGVVVQFTATPGGSITTVAVSDASGRVEALWTLGTASGTHTARASVAGTSAVADFTATATPGTAVSLTVLSGDGQTGPAGLPLPQEIRVTVRDQFGNPVGAGTSVTFSPSVGGAVASAQVVTDASGTAGTQWTLSRTAGTNASSASLPSGAAVLFHATGFAGDPARMVALSGDGQTGTPGELLAPLVVQLLDIDANPVGAGFEVLFTTQDGSVNPARAVTDASGQVTTDWTLGLILGRQSVRATLASNPAVELQFDANVVPGAPTTIAIVSGNNQGGLPGQALASPLVVQVTDAAANPVPNATVDFAVASGGGSVLPVSATTNATGTASTTWTLGLAGVQSATATLSGVPGQVLTFAATLTVGPPTQISIVSGNAQTGTAGSALAAPVVIQVLDAFNNPVPGVTVDFAAASGSGSISPASPTTNASGQVSGAWTLGIFPGSNTGTATVSGSALSVNLSATGNAPPFSLLTVGSHTCGLASVAYCWGPNGAGGLGDGTTTNRSQPTLVSGGLVFGALAAGDYFTCGLAGTGAYCWGGNGAGQLGDGTTTSRSTAAAVSGGHAFAMIASAGSHACGVTTGDQAFCWGLNANGNLGDGTNTNRTTPTAVAGGLSFAYVSTGIDHSCGLTPTGQAYCWGGNGDGQLGNGTTTSSNLPVAVLGGLTFSSITLGGAHTCALTPAGQAWCWGRNAFGELGTGNNTASSVPVAVTGGLAFSGIDTGNRHTCALSGNTAYCWGDNGSGQLGDGTGTGRNSPTAVTGGLAFTSVAAGFFTTCATTATTAYCWGDNWAGQLGNGSTGGFTLAPVAVIQP